MLDLIDTQIADKFCRSGHAFWWFGLDKTKATSQLFFTFCSMCFLKKTPKRPRKHISSEKERSKNA